MTPALSIRALRLAFDGTAILDGLDLEVGAGESVALLGPSGSGKTSLLSAVAGFLPVDGGEVVIAGRTVAARSVHEAPERRGVAMVFQQAALWPHLTALETVAYPMRRAGRSRMEAEERAWELLEAMSVGHLAERRPSQLSGGEQQRVGVARALARGAPLLLLDEPTAHLDAPLRAALLAEVAEQRARVGAAALWATHDVTEALAIADRVAVLRDGRIVQAGTPQELYERPVDPWTARLTGAASLLDFGADGPPAGARIDGLADRDRAILVRPDWAELGGELAGTVVASWYRGTHTDHRIRTDAGELEIRTPGPPRAGVGERVGWRLLRGWALSPPEPAPGSARGSGRDPR